MQVLIQIDTETIKLLLPVVPVAVVFWVNRKRLLKKLAENRYLRHFLEG